MRRIFAILLVCFTASTAVVAQEEDEWYVGKPIADFSFIGLETVSLTELRPLVRTYIGESFTYEIFYEIQAKLYELDYFEEIGADAKPADEAKSSVIIEFTIRERPTVELVAIEGNANVSRASLLDKILIKRGDFAARSQINIDAESIRQLYLEKGFPDVQVTGDIDLEAEANSVTVTFRIDEGSETKIRDILFSGNSFASDSTLRRVMKTKEQSVFSTGSYRENFIDRDMDFIAEYYRKNGFIDAAVVKIDRSEEFDEEANQRFLILTVYVEEGMQYSYGGMTVRDNEVFSDDEIQSLLRLKIGDLLNMQKVEAAYQRVIGLYLDNGYLENEFRREVIRDEELKVISFEVTVVEKSKSHVENIIIQGNDKTKDYVILRELPFDEGDIFSRDKLYEGWRNLYNLQYFSTVDILPVRGSSDGLVDYIISVEEQSWADFRFAFSFSGLDFPVSGSFGWSDKNFLGTGRSIGFDLEASTVRQGLSANFQDNYLFAKDFGGGISLSTYHNKVSNVYQDIIPPIFTDTDIPDPYQSLEEYNEALASGLSIPAAATMSYDSVDISFSVNSSYFYRSVVGRLGLQTGLSITSSYIWYDPLLYRPYDATVRNNRSNWDLINTLGTTLYWDNRDIFYNPTTGFYLSQYLGFTGGFLFGSREYISIKTRAEGYLTLFSVPMGENFDFEMVLATHSAVSFITPTFGAREVTSSEDLLALDGITVARGWPYVSGYHALWENSLELRSPIIRQYIWWSWFFDVAAAWTEISQMANISIEDFYFSFGGGARLTLPGFPIRFYLAQTFSFENGALVWGDGDFNLGKNLSLKFVLSFTPPGGF